MPASGGCCSAKWRAFVSMSSMLSIICCPVIQRCIGDSVDWAAVVSGWARQLEINLLSVLLSEMGLVLSGVLV